MNAEREEPIAVISLFIEDIPQLPGLPQPQIAHGTWTIRFRKFACHTAYQRKGIGSHLLEYAVSLAQSEMNGALLWCDARLTASEWYQQRGLKPFGDTFHKGHVEYVRMKREFSSSGENLSEIFCGGA